ncbi:hypothetical protein C8N36_106255 [Pelagimonas varians]|uniref:Uncharacterized protein n=1 Tax=Pelagimonas varians TaxID=696760 RepID=A0A238K5X1_9RHOB|nr:hypothetical protein C8N36_106255 [Pelagimonas varians]SMX37336.1 hypothetical protein PEV8663_01035 [Pelagimonas varians]
MCVNEMADRGSTITLTGCVAGLWRGCQSPNSFKLGLHAGMSLGTPVL